MNLPDLSQTAIYTLLCRAIQTEKRNHVIDDPMAVFCLNNLIALASEEDKKRILKWKKLIAGLGARDAKLTAQRASEIDWMVNDYISNNPSCTVMSLACGFDTRFWRIENRKCKYIELDLPGVIALKKETLKENLNYELIESSVFDTTWINRVTSNGNSHFLLIAEGLFMYLPEADSKRLFLKIAQRFKRSQVILDMMPERYTRGFLQKYVAWQYKFFMGIHAPYVFGVQDPSDIELYGDGYKVLHSKGRFPSWIISASINENT